MSNRSGTTYSAPTDADRRPVMLGVSTVDGKTPLPLEVDPLTGLLQVSGGGSGGGGTQYTDGATPPTHPIGTMPIFNNAGTWAEVSNTAGLPVAIVSGGGSGGTSSNFSSAFPSAGTAIGATDGTNMQPLKVDGSDNLLVKVNAALPAGTNVIGHAIIDTGSTTAVTQATASNLNATVVGTGTFAVQAAQSGTWNINNISGTVSLPTGAATAAKQPALGTAGTASADVLTVQGIASMAALKVDGSGVTQPVSLTSTTITGTVAVTESGTWVVGSNSATGSAVPANAFMIGGSDGTNLRAAKSLTDGTLNVVQSATTGTLTQVNSSASSVTVLASNVARKGATFYNNSTQILYLAFGSTSSTTAFTVPLASGTFFEMPSGYNGVVSGIWASANGNCIVTEIT